jgi:hypothetical protein
MRLFFSVAPKHYSFTSWPDSRFMCLAQLFPTVFPVTSQFSSKASAPVFLVTFGFLRLTALLNQSRF